MSTLGSKIIDITTCKSKYQIIKPARVPALLHSTQLLQKEAPWYFHESMAFEDTDAKERVG